LNISIELTIPILFTLKIILLLFYDKLLIIINYLIMKMLKKFNLHKRVLSCSNSTRTLFSYSNKKYTTEDLQILSTKVNRNSQEFQVNNLYLFYRIIIKI